MYRIVKVSTQLIYHDTIQSPTWNSTIAIPYNILYTVKTATRHHCNERPTSDETTFAVTRTYISIHLYLQWKTTCHNKTTFCGLVGWSLTRDFTVSNFTGCQSNFYNLTNSVISYQYHCQLYKGRKKKKKKLYKELYLLRNVPHVYYMFDTHIIHESKRYETLALVPC